MKILQITAIVVVVLFVVVSCTRWKWGECRKVGHGVAYCVMDMGR